MAVGTQEIAVFEDARGRLAAIAYRLLGSTADAEDAVQDTFIRWQAADHTQIVTPQAWLTKVLTNICLNQLTSARTRREQYVGQWLPEPVLNNDPLLGPAELTEQRESVSVAMLTLMERLSANERVVYVLREAFGYAHREIADMLELNETNCQQIYRRAKHHLASERARIVVDETSARRIVEEFLAATLSGDPNSLVRLLTDDAVSIGDGGGIVSALPMPVTGGLRVARYLRKLFEPSDTKFELLGGRPDFYATVANCAPSIVMVVRERIVGIITLDVTDAGIAAVHAQVNPEKLRRANDEWGVVDHGMPLTVVW